MSLNVGSKRKEGLGIDQKFKSHAIQKPLMIQPFDLGKIVNFVLELKINNSSDKFSKAI